MIMLNEACRILRSISRQSCNFKYHKKLLVRSLVNQVQSEPIISHTKETQKQSLVRKYCTLSPNILKSQPKDVEIPNTLFIDYLWDRNDRWGNKTAIVCGITGREISYFKLRNLCKKFATTLLKEGFKPGQVIAIITPNILEFPVITFGSIEAGIAVTTINSQYTADEIAKQIKDSGAVAVISIPNKLADILEAKNILMKQDKEVATKLRVICTPDVNGNDQDIPAGIERYSKYVSDSVDESALPSLQNREISLNDVLLIPYSSGTTGIPKGVCHTHSNLLAQLIQLNHTSIFKEASNSFQDVLPLIIPGFHIYGFTVLTLGMFNGVKIITLPKFEENSFLKALKDHKTTLLAIVPPLLLYIASNPAVTEEHLKSLRIILSGAAPSAETDMLKCINKGPRNLAIRQGYGTTETGTVTNGNPNNYNSVGKLVAGISLKVADLQNGQALGPNKEGEICLKGPQIMKGYLNNDKATADVFDSEGFYHTGDLGYYDETEDIYITDRIKELIKVKGFQVAPAELEAVLRSHSEIEDAGVIGVPDKNKGEVPIAFLKAKYGTTPCVEDLKQFLSKKLAKYKQVDKFIFIDSIPKSASGKILRKDLKSNYLTSLKN